MEKILGVMEVTKKMLVVTCFLVLLVTFSGYAPGFEVPPLKFGPPKRLGPPNSSTDPGTPTLLCSVNENDDAQDGSKHYRN